jgi:hypothetical protein
MTDADSRSDRLVTGLCGLFAGAISLPMGALYFVYDGPPPLDNVITRNLLTIAMLVGFLVFAAGLVRLLRTDGEGLAGSIAVSALKCYVAVALVATSIELGTSLWYPDGSLDPTVDGPLSAADVLLHGPITRILLAVFLIGLAVATRRGVLPGWARVGSVVVAVINLAMVPSIFFGMDAAFVYAANGWGSVAITGVLTMLWVGALGAAVLRARPASRAVRPPDRHPCAPLGAPTPAA